MRRCSWVIRFDRTPRMLQAGISIPAISRPFNCAAVSGPLPIKNQSPVFRHQQPHLQRDIDQGSNGNPILERQPVDRRASNRRDDFRCSYFFFSHDVSSPQPSFCATRLSAHTRTTANSTR